MKMIQLWIAYVVATMAMISSASAQLPWPFAPAAGGCVPFCIGPSAVSAGVSVSSTSVTINVPAGSVVFVGAYATAVGTPAVSTVTSANLTFSLLKAKLGGTTTDIELWYATSANALAAEAITVTMTGSVSTLDVLGVGISGAYTLVSAFDTNAAASQVDNVTSGGPKTLTQSTSQRDDLLFWFSVGSSVGSTGNLPPTGFSTILSFTGLGDVKSGAFGYKIVNQPTSSVGYVSTSGNAGSGAVMTAITASPHTVGTNTGFVGAMPQPLSHW